MDENPTQEMFEVTPKKTFYPVPIELFAPPRSSGLSLYRAECERKAADLKLTVSRVLCPKQQVGRFLEWSTLGKCKATLRTLFIDSNQSIKESKASRLRFHEIMKEKESDTGMLQDQMFNVKIEIDKYRKVTAEMEKHVEKYSVYETFLENVAQVSPEYNSGGDILNRYEALENTRSLCARLLKKELEGFSEMRSNMTTLVETKSTRLKDLGNRVVALQVQQKLAKERRTFWERTVERMKSMIALHKEEDLIMTGGCWDLYLQICARCNVKPTISQRDIEGQLDFIEKSINFLKEVHTLAVSNVQAQKK